ncbi:calcium/cation antiporter [Nostoc commune NIES-4072]|uniref:Ca(2+)/H(+) antiporter n=1 Tax=Nostoc commune NIES-4072 TaxID=2005467 RepID=A0A2R5FJG6_NOSCO|nr:calcium/proton exchanger [Nostoc commune]BBD63799.1 calcium/cation antiporter [Nostoc commune HK-02]GBG18880.1 calcium/cation antiporter [Nostoc commune NIES-4072]
MQLQEVKQVLSQPSINWLAIFLPISLVIAYLPGLRNEIFLFFTSCLGMVVVAYWLGNATEQLADKVGCTWGGMMNAAFSNLPELIFGLIAVAKGLGPLAKAAWTGAIISNMLVAVGAAIMVGGYRFGTVTFPLDRAKDAAAGLMIAAVAILMPSVYAHAVDFSSENVSAADVIKNVSVWLSVFLLMAYGGSIIYTLARFRYSEPALQAKNLVGAFVHSESAPQAKNLAEVFVPEEDVEMSWDVPLSIGVLAASSVLMAFLSNFVADCVDSVTTGLGWTEMFVGAIVIGIIGNVGAIMSAVLVAYKNKLDLSFEIGMNAASQVALLVIPTLIIASSVVGKPVDFLFSPPQIAALIGSVLIMTQISQDGRCNWLNGLQMLIFFGVISVLFFYDPT